MQFLKQNNKRVAGKAPTASTGKTIESNMLANEIMATDKNIIVIGGGDTGSDCVCTSNGHKAESVTQFELLPKPPESRTPFMRWPTYPMLLKTTTSHEEGGNRHWAIVTKAFLGDVNGKLKAVKVVDVEWTGSNDGKPTRFVEIPGTERDLPC
jgi:glutamate synthase (NADPH/NADH) small chain